MFPKVNLEQDFGIYLYINQQQCRKACMNIKNYWRLSVYQSSFNITQNLSLSFQKIKMKLLHRRPQRNIYFEKKKTSQ